MGATEEQMPPELEAGAEPSTVTALQARGSVAMGSLPGHFYLCNLSPSNSGVCSLGTEMKWDQDKTVSWDPFKIIWYNHDRKVRNIPNI